MICNVGLYGRGMSKEKINNNPNKPSCDKCYFFPCNSFRLRYLNKPDMYTIPKSCPTYYYDIDNDIEKWIWKIKQERAYV